MLPFVQEQEDEQYTEMASDFRDSSGHLSLFHRQLTRKHFMLIQWEYMHDQFILNAPFRFKTI